MTKEHYKLVKTHAGLFNKAIYTTAATAAALTLGFGITATTQAHAATNDLAITTPSTNIDSRTQVAQQEVNTQENNVKSAQASVDQAQQTVNQTQNANDQAQANVKSDQANLDAATKAQQGGQIDIGTMTRNVKNDQQKQQAAQQAVDQANADVNAKSNAQSTAQKTVDDLQQQLANPSSPASKQNLPNFNFTADQKSTAQNYVKAINRILSSGNWSSAEFSQVPEFQAWENAMTTKQGIKWQDNSAADQKKQINLKSLTVDQVKELSLFSAAVMNNLRNELGISNLTGKAVVTTGMISEAKEVSELYNRDDPKGNGHYIYALKKAAFDHGMTSQDATNADKFVSAGNGYGESLFGLGNSEFTNTISMAAAKGEIVSAIANMLFNDKGGLMGHADSMIGLYDNGKNDYLGTSLSFSSQNPEMDEHLTHFIQFTPADFNNAQSPAEKAKQNAAQMTDEVIQGSPELQNKLNAAEKQLNNAKTALNNSQVAAKTAQNNLQAAKDQLAKDQKALQDQQNAKSPAEMQKVIDDAKTALKGAQFKAAQLAEALKNAKLILNNKKVNLATMQHNLKVAQENLAKLTASQQPTVPDSSNINQSTTLAQTSEQPTTPSTPSTVVQPTAPISDNAAQSSTPAQPNDQPASDSSMDNPIVSTSDSATQPGTPAQPNDQPASSSFEDSPTIVSGVNANDPSNEQQSIEVVNNGHVATPTQSGNNIINNNQISGVNATSITGNNAEIANTAASIESTTPKSSNQQQARLPQTGNRETLGLGLSIVAAVMMTFGFDYRKKEA